MYQKDKYLSKFLICYQNKNLLSIHSHIFYQEAYHIKQVQKSILIHTFSLNYLHNMNLDILLYTYFWLDPQKYFGK